MTGSAPRSLREADAAARRAAQTVFDRPVVLEAGAGTGKTGTLVARILVWCTGPGWERATRELSMRGEIEDSADECCDDAIAARTLERVVAITFTEAAASEMAERVGQALSQIVDRNPSPTLLRDLLPPSDVCERRARALLGRLERLGVRTIHGYCRRILASFPLEAGLHPAFEVDAAGTALAETVREVIEEWLHTEESIDALVRLAPAAIGPQQLEEALLELVDAGVNEEALAADPYAPERVVRFVDCGSALLQAFAEASLDSLKGLGGRAQVAREVRDALEDTRAALAKPPESRAGLVELTEWAHEIWTERAYKRLSEWGRGRFTKEESRALGDREAVVAKAAVPLARWLSVLVTQKPHELEAARQIVAPLLARVSRLLAARGVVTYAALIRDARTLLEHEPSVAERVREPIDQLLVDEFQDTDDAQCAILRALALDAEPSRRPGLFLVGDPKQSIYGWRRADLAAYEAFVDEVLGVGGERHALCVNFRSDPEILREVERIMEPVMRYARGLQPAFQTLLPAERGGEAERSGATSVEHWVTWAAGSDAQPARSPRAGEAAEIEARAVAQDILRQHRERAVAFGDIALLFRARTDLDVYLEALRSAAIPYVVDGHRGYYRRREIIDAAALVRSVLDPKDTLSLVTWLRSASVGVPDAAWLPLWRRGFPERMAELLEPDPARLDSLRSLIRAAAAELQPTIPRLGRISGWEICLIDAVEAIAELRATFDREPPDRFVERLRSRTAIEVSEGARHLGRYRIANLERFFRDLSETLSAGSGDPAALLRHLRRAVRDDPRSDEARPRETVEDAVSVLTIHQAKGLDFSQVYLLQTHRRTGSRHGAGTVVGRTENQWEYRLFGWSTLELQSLEDRARRVAQAEQVRTLYVALTRAKHRLVVAGIWPEASPGPDPWDEATSHADLIAARSGERPDLAELSLEVAGPVHWRLLPALGEASAGGHPAPPAAPGDELVAAKRTVHQHLERLRRDAATHESRAFGAPASSAHAGANQGDRLRSGPIHSLPGRPWDEEGSFAHGLDRSAARALGSAMHALLETLDLQTLPPSQIELWDQLDAQLRARIDPGAKLDATRAQARTLLERLVRGPLLQRLIEMAPHVVARELPFVAGPEITSHPAADDARGASNRYPERRPRNVPAPDLGPVAYWSGVIDLVHRDPGSGVFTVVDYKTDVILDEAGLRDRTARYTPQAAIYASAVHQALQLPTRPRCELWFLYSGDLVVID